MYTVKKSNFIYKKEILFKLPEFAKKNIGLYIILLRDTAALNCFWLAVTLAHVEWLVIGSLGARRSWRHHMLQLWKNARKHVRRDLRNLLIYPPCMQHFYARGPGLDSRGGWIFQVPKRAATVPHVLAIVACCWNEPDKVVP